MKQVLFILLTLLTLNSFSQTITYRGTTKTIEDPRLPIIKNYYVSDTLVVDISKYKFVKIGDKIYSADISLNMVPMNGGIQFYRGLGTGTITLENKEFPYSGLLYTPNKQTDGQTRKQ